MIRPTARDWRDQVATVNCHKHCTTNLYCYAKDSNTLLQLPEHDVVLLEMRLLVLLAASSNEGTNTSKLCSGNAHRHTMECHQQVTRCTENHTLRQGRYKRAAPLQ